jgi:hypothetical protein
MAESGKKQIKGWIRGEGGKKIKWFRRKKESKWENWERFGMVI